MKTLLVDSHCHLDFSVLNDNIKNILEKSHDAGVDLMVTISTRVREFDKIRTIAEAHDNVYCTIGTHPHNADEEIDITCAEIVEISKHPKVVGIGEAGLDYHYDNSTPKAQAQGFRTHIAAARQTGLPLIIHAREADKDTADILTEETGKGAFPFVLHCFTAGRDLAMTGIELGGYVSFSGVITFKSAEELRAIARDLPGDRILVETDAPYLAPVPMRGRPNEPSYVRHTAQCLADTRQLSLEQLAFETSENFFRLFSKVPMPEAYARNFAA
jgi:TatD DNase family protein